MQGYNAIVVFDEMADKNPVFNFAICSIEELCLRRYLVCVLDTASMCITHRAQ